MIAVRQQRVPRVENRGVKLGGGHLVGDQELLNLALV